MKSLFNQKEKYFHNEPLRCKQNSEKKNQNNSTKETGRYELRIRAVVRHNTLKKRNTYYFLKSHSSKIYYLIRKGNAIRLNIFVEENKTHQLEFKCIALNKGI